MRLLPAVLCLLLLPAGAGAGETTRVNWTEFEDFDSIVVDPARGNVFLSGGDGSTVIEVFDPSGGVLKLIENERDIGPMVIHENDLYAYRRTAGMIDVIDTELLEWKQSIDVPDPSGLATLAKAGGRLWVSTRECEFGPAEATGIPLGEEPLVTIPDAAPHCAFLLSPDPSGDTLYAFGSFFSGSTVTRWDVSTRPPKAEASRHIPVFGGVTFSPDGSVMYVPVAYSRVQAYSTADLTPLWSYETTDEAQGMGTDVSPDGDLLAVGLSIWNEDEKPDLNVFAAGGGRPVDTTYLTGDGPVEVFGRGVAFGPDGRTVYVVADEEESDPDHGGEMGQTKLYTIAVTPPVPGSPTDLELSVGHLGGNRYAVHCESAGTLANEKVRLMTTNWYGTQLAKVVTMNDHGRCDAGIEMASTGSVYAEFRGSAGRAPSRSAPVSVSGRPTVVAQLFGGVGRKKGRYRFYERDARPLVRGSVHPIFPDLKVGFLAQARVDGEWETADRAAFPMSARGEALATLKRGEFRVPYRVRTEFRYSGGRRLASRWSYFKLGPPQCPYVCKSTAARPSPGDPIRWSKGVVDTRR